jgi:hypothetical protein
MGSLQTLAWTGLILFRFALAFARCRVLGRSGFYADKAHECHSSVRMALAVRKGRVRAVAMLASGHSGPRLQAHERAESSPNRHSSVKAKFIKEQAV